MKKIALYTFTLLLSLLAVVTAPVVYNQTIQAQDAPASSNLALYKPIVSSSDELAELGPNQAVDGNAYSRWGSQWRVIQGVDTQWVYVDLGSSQNVKRVKLEWETAYGKAYQVQTSNDASNWTTIYSTTNGDGWTDDLNNLSGTGRYVRVYMTQRGTEWGYSLWELEVYGDSTPNPTGVPTGAPTTAPTVSPTKTPTPTVVPTKTPTATPTVVPTATTTPTPTTVPAPKVCTFVSDTSNTVEGGGNAIPSYTYPNYTSMPGATWIWSSYYVQSPTTTETKTFVKTFNATTPVTNATVVVAADNDFSILVNGTKRFTETDGFTFLAGNQRTYNLAPYIKNGTNTVAFQVTNTGVPGSTIQSNPAGLLYKLTVNAADCSAVTPTPTPTIVPTATPTAAPAPTNPPSTGGPSVSATVTYNGKTRDVVSPGETLAPDGQNDGSFTVNLSTSKTITSVALTGPNATHWNTTPDGYWILAVASTPTGSVLNASNGTVNFSASSFTAFASDYSDYFKAGNDMNILVTYSDGTVSTGTVKIGGSAPKACFPVPANIIGWWRAEGNANDSVSGNNGVMQAGATTMTGKVGQSFVFPGNDPDEAIIFPQAPAKFNLNTQVTLEAWIKPLRLTSTTGRPASVISKGTYPHNGKRNYGLYIASDGRLHLSSTDVNGTPTNSLNSAIGTDPVLKLNTWHHVAATITWGPGGSMNLYLDGVLKESQPINFYPTIETTPLTIGNEVGKYPFASLIDEASVYNRALSGAEIQGIYNAQEAGKCR